MARTSVFFVINIYNKGEAIAIKLQDKYYKGSKLEALTEKTHQPYKLFLEKAEKAR